MKSQDFTAQLRWASHEAHLSTADLKIWFDRPYQTVRRWLEGSAPYQDRREVENRLAHLLEAIEMRMLPLPTNLKQSQRAINLRGIYSVVTSGPFAGLSGEIATG